MMHITDNQEAFLDYLYEEGDPAERVKVAQHLQQCAPCSVAVLELQSVRGLLAEWTPPEAPLGFQVVQRDAATPVAVPVQKGSRSLFWAQAAAAVLLFAAGMGASQLRVQYADGALTVRTRTAEPAVAAEAPITHAGTDILLAPGSIERVTASGTAPASASVDEMLRRVQALIDQSESRQQRQLALRLQDVVHDFDTQRQADMRRVNQDFGQLEDQTSQEVARSRELVNSLVKVSQGGVR
jgi:polyhydroxyalkanoate synthesis regulator phasin